MQYGNIIEIWQPRCQSCNKFRKHLSAKILQFPRAEVVLTQQLMRNVAVDLKQSEQTARLKHWLSSLIGAQSPIQISFQWRSLDSSISFQSLYNKNQSLVLDVEHQKVLLGICWDVKEQQRLVQRSRPFWKPALH